MQTKDENINQIPTLKQALDKLMTSGTVVGQISAPISFEDDSIIFDNSPLSAVKSLKVNLYSTETEEMGILHKLHTMTRSVE